MNKRALIAMSGGVDSSVAAYLMKDKYECTGVTMRLYDPCNAPLGCDKACCTSKDIEDAKNVSQSLGMPYKVVDFQDKFEEKVIVNFINTYVCGGTPNPCIDCNRYLKFEKLLEEMYNLGCDYVVTGHYARVEYDEKKGRYLLKKGLDESKDQSYVLYSLTQKQLAHTLLPLGNFSKEQIREFAREQGLVTAEKKDSQDICFVPDGDYAAFIERFTGKTFPKGNFVDTEGKVLGEHKGIIRYTVGQRKGIGISFPEPVYVLKTDVKTNTVTLCKNEELFSKELDADDVNLISVEKITEPLHLTAKIRYKHKEAPCVVSQTGEKTVHVIFDEPQRAITKGQSVVFYDGDTVVGGGKII